MTRHADYFDFDDWAALAKSDPAAFERRRRAATRAIIDGAAPANRQRLTGLQWRADMERRRATTPMAACVRINRLMMAKFRNDLVPSLSRFQGNAAAVSNGTAVRSGGRADVIALGNRPRQP